MGCDDPGRYPRRRCGSSIAWCARARAGARARRAMAEVGRTHRHGGADRVLAGCLRPERPALSTRRPKRPWSRGPPIRAGGGDTQAPNSPQTPDSPPAPSSPAPMVTLRGDAPGRRFQTKETKRRGTFAAEIAVCIPVPISCWSTFRRTCIAPFHALPPFTQFAGRTDRRGVRRAQHAVEVPQGLRPEKIAVVFRCPGNVPRTTCSPSTRHTADDARRLACTDPAVVTAVQSMAAHPAEPGVERTT